MTGISCIEWPWDVRWAHVWECFHLPICRQYCEVRGVCPPTHIGCGHNECNSQRGSIWGRRLWIHIELDGVVWFAPRIVLVDCNIQNTHGTYQCNEADPMGGNPTVCNYFGHFYLLVWQVEASWVSWWCILRMGGRLGAWILAVLRWLSHPFMDFSDWTNIYYAYHDLKVQDKNKEDFSN